MKRGDKSISLAASAARFLLMLAAVALALAVLDWIPGVADRGTLRQYGSVEQLKAAPGFGSLKVPSYFHESVRWPPARIVGMSRPFMAAVMVFDGSAGEGTLVISESTSERFMPDGVAEFSELRQSVGAEVRGLGATLETGLCPDGGSCARLRYKDGDIHVTMFMRGPSVNLLRMAESMSGH